MLVEWEIAPLLRLLAPRGEEGRGDEESQQSRQQGWRAKNSPSAALNSSG
jgi:hypothetical protein